MTYRAINCCSNPEQKQDYVMSPKCKFTQYSHYKSTTMRSPVKYSSQINKVWVRPLNGGDSPPKLGESNDLLTQKLAQNAKNSENSGFDASVQTEIGDGPGTRTPNLVIKSHLLCQLS